MRIGGLPRPSIARPVLGARPIRVEDGKRRYCGIPTGDVGNYRFCTRVLNSIVGASIARPVLGARPIRIKNEAYRFCDSPKISCGVFRYITTV